MNETNKSHPAIDLAVTGFEKYRNQGCDLAGLQQNLASARSLLDGSLDRALRECVEWAENEIESVRFMVEAKDQVQEAERVWIKLDEAIRLNHRATT